MSRTNHSKRDIHGSTDTARAEAHGLRVAKRMLAGVAFIPVAPLRVEEFSGGLIGSDERESWVTDFHIVDARGRTITVVPYVRSRQYRRERADRYCADMNALLAEMEPAAA